MKLSPWARRGLALLLVAAAGWYLARAVAGNWQELRTYPWEVRPVALAASIAAHVAVLAWGVWVWSRVLEHFEHPPVRLGMLQRIWFLSNLARYIPGKVFQFLAVAQLSRAEGLSGAVMLTSMIVHTGLALLSAALLSAWTLGGSLFPALPAPWIGLAATAVALPLVHPAVLNAALGVLPRLLKRPVIRWNGGWGSGIVLLALATLSWVLYGGAYWLYIHSLADVPASTLPALSGVNSLSFLVGYLFFLTPGGIGPREVTMAGLLTPYLTPGVAALLAVASRLWTILAELLGGTIAVMVARRGADGRGAAEAAGGLQVVSKEPAPPN